MKKSRYFFTLVFLCAFCFTTVAQEEPDPIFENFTRQLIAYPQEKIYAHNDKTCYIAGEDVWFRAHLVNGMSHMPDTASRYVYAELINPLDSIISRIKIRPEGGAYQGYISLPEELPEGDYHLRFYTKFMESLGDNYFFHKKITVGAPLSGLYRTLANFEYTDDGKKVNAKLSFRQISDGQPFIPDKVKIRNAQGIARDLKINDDGQAQVNFSINPQKDLKNNVLDIEYNYRDKFLRQYIPLPAMENEYNVSFFPEGGNMPAGVMNRVAFKALKSNGMAEVITGRIVSASGDTITTFKSNHLGMSFLFIIPEASMTYYAFCTNEKGIQKKFELPPAQPDALSLKTLWSKGMLTVSVNHSPNIQLTQPLYLIMHCRGVPLYNDVWNNNSQYLQFPQEIMPSGIINILLVDQNMNPISERMIFNTNELEQVSVTFETDKSNYQKRDAVSAKIKLADANNNPLKGSMSISITDDKDVKPDTCNNIFTALLLASELKGYIESPAYYFSGDESNSRTLQTQLDALMLTQGWTRYNVPAVIKGEIEKPTSYLEAGFVISGTVKGGVMMTNASKESIVSLISHNYPFFDTTTSDENGKFIFAGFELPDTVNYIVQASSPKGGTRFELSLDENLSPPIKKQMLWEYSGDRTNNPDFENYMSKAEEKFVIENGVRTIFLKEVTVVGKAKEKVNRSPFSSPFNQIVSEEEIEKMRAIDMRMILMRLSGVIVSGNTVRIRNNPGDPLVLVDNMETDMDMLLNFQVLDIAEIEVFKDATAAIFGSRGGNGVILITTKSGEVPTRQREKYNMKIYQPLGYQVVKEFYMPAYDTPERKRSSEPDLRTTVYWNPNVNSSAETGEAQVNFFAADTSTTYSVIIEGMTPDGQIIRSVQKIRRED